MNAAEAEFRRENIANAKVSNHYLSFYCKNTRKEWENNPK